MILCAVSLCYGGGSLSKRGARHKEKIYLPPEIEAQIMSDALAKPPYPPITQWLLEQSEKYDSWLKHKEIPSIPLVDHREPITVIAISPDESFVATGSKDMTVNISNLQTGKLIASLQGHSGPVSALAITPDSSKIVTGSKDSTIKVWGKMGELMYTLQNHEAPIIKLAITPDGSKIVSESSDGIIMVWDSATGSLLNVINNGNSRFLTFVITADGSKIISNFERYINVWNIKTGEQMSSWETPLHEISSLATIPHNKSEILVAGVVELLIWDIKNGNRVHTLLNGRDMIFSVSATQDGSCALAGTNNGMINIFKRNAYGRFDFDCISSHHFMIADVACPDNMHVIFRASSKIYLRNIDSKHHIQSFKGERYAATSDCSQIVTTLNKKAEIRTVGSLLGDIKKLTLKQMRLLYVIRDLAKQHKKMVLTSDDELTLKYRQPYDSLPDPIKYMIDEFVIA